MAVNVDTVYQRVLAILNKEQRGYLTPEEYNLFANQAQLDIFEQYFYDINQFNRIPGNDTEYSDMLDILNEKISLFEKTNQTVTNGTDLPTDLYRLGSVIFNNSEAEQIDQKDWLYIKSSPLAQPTNDFPIYIRDINGIKVYGKDNNGALEQKTSSITCNYIKKPAKVIWNYTTVLNNAQYTATGSQNFELHESEETDLVIKILALAGVLVQDVGMYQIASQEDAKNVQQEKS